MNSGVRSENSPASGFEVAAERYSVDTLFYDGNCPLCRKEVAILSRLAQPTLAFQDVHVSCGETTPTTAALLQTLHLRRYNGEWVTGLAANVAMWQHTRVGWVWRVVMLPGIRQIAERVYVFWARRRYERLYNCADGAACSTRARPEGK